MNKRLLGYIAWDFAENKPKVGTRRFKVWTSISEASKGIPAGSKPRSDQHPRKPNVLS